MLEELTTLDAFLNGFMKESVFSKRTLWLFHIAQLHHCGPDVHVVNVGVHSRDAYR